MSAATMIPNTWFLNGGDFPEALVEGIVKTLCPPPHLCDLELSRFVRLVLASMSLSLLNKNRILESLPTLTAFQIHELRKVFVDETLEFSKLKEDKQIACLSAAAIFGAFCLATYRGAEQGDAQQVASLLRKMLTSKLAASPATRQHLQFSASVPPLVAYVYGDSVTPGSGSGSDRRKRASRGSSGTTIEPAMEI